MLGCLRRTWKSDSISRSLTFLKVDGLKSWGTLVKCCHMLFQHRALDTEKAKRMKTGKGPAKNPMNQVFRFFYCNTDAVAKSSNMFANGGPPANARGCCQDKEGGGEAHVFSLQLSICQDGLNLQFPDECVNYAQKQNWTRQCLDNLESTFSLDIPMSSNLIQLESYMSFSSGSMTAAKMASLLHFQALAQQQADFQQSVRCWQRRLQVQAPQTCSAGIPEMEMGQNL